MPPPENNLTYKNLAFTLAECLITLGIIGVVAALTLPPVIQNYKKHVLITKLKKSYSILGQVAQKSINDNGAIDLPIGDRTNGNDDTTEKFFQTYWLPYFDGVKVSPSDEDIKLNNDNIPSYKQLNNEYSKVVVKTLYNSGRIFFTTKDGMTYFVNVKGTKHVFDENGNIVSEYGVFAPKQRVLVDINGLQPPNTYGKDVFSFVIDFEEGTVKPLTEEAMTPNSININCQKVGLFCAAKIMQDNWQIKKDYPSL